MTVSEALDVIGDVVMAAAVVGRSLAGSGNRSMVFASYSVLDSKDVMPSCCRP